MSSAVTAMPLYLAESAALAVQQLLQPGCERVAVAGSVRRRRDVCNDVEIVAIPRIEEATRPGQLLPVEVDRLDELLAPVKRGDHPVLFRPKAMPGHREPAWGPRYKKLYVRHQRRWIKVDLWLTTRQRWGAIYAIRTGEAEFSKLLVTPRVQGGAMPRDMRQAEGSLQHIVGHANGEPVYEPLYTPEESDFFAALDVPQLLPEERTALRLRHLLSKRQPAANP